jgi:hypothetical protein
MYCFVQKVVRVLDGYLLDGSKMVWEKRIKKVGITGGALSLNS